VQMLKGNRQILGSSPSPESRPPSLQRVILWWTLANPSSVPNWKSLAPAVAEILKGNPKILWNSPSPRPPPLFSLGVILWWAVANPSCIPNLKSLALAVAEILKEKPLNSGNSPSPGPPQLFLLVGFDDGPWQTPSVCQIWSRWLHVLRKYKGICF